MEAELLEELNENDREAMTVLCSNKSAFSQVDPLESSQFLEMPIETQSKQLLPHSATHREEVPNPERAQHEDEEKEEEVVPSRIGKTWDFVGLG